jgi:plasmid stabilization system protein ParE
MKSLRFLRRAREDLDEIVDYYNLEVEGLGYRFSDQLEQILDHMQTFPESYVSLGGRVRRAAMRDFPYNIHYANYPDEIIVASIAHQHRHPDHWKSCLKDLP